MVGPVVEGEGGSGGRSFHLLCRPVKLKNRYWKFPFQGHEGMEVDGNCHLSAGRKEREKASSSLMRVGRRLSSWMTEYKGEFSG